MKKEFFTGRGIKIPDQHVVVIDRSPFIKFPGLIKIGHDTAEQMNGRLTQTNYNIVQIPSKENENVAIILVEMAVQAKDSDEILCRFHGIGDASPKSVGARISPHIIRMAETRAVARALRIMTDVGMTALEELDGGMPASEPPSHNEPEENKPEKSDKRVALEKELLALKSEKGFSNTSLIKSINLKMNKAIKGISEITDEDIRTYIDSFKDKKIESPEHTESPPEQAKVEQTKNDRASLMKEIKTVADKYKLKPSDIKILAIELFKKPKDFKASELTDEELQELINEINNKNKDKD